MTLLLAAYSFFDPFTRDGGDWGLIWLPLCLLAVLTSFLIHNVILMFGKSFNISSFEHYAKAEMMQSVATAVIAIFLVLMIGSAMELSQGIVSGEFQCGDENIRIGESGPQSAMEETLDAIRCRLQLKASQIGDIQGKLYGGIMQSSFYTMSMMWGIFGIRVYQGDWSSSLYSFTETARITNNLATVMLIGLNAQSFLVLYIKYNMLTMFLPIGILLRSFHFTRGVGALFMATAIGLYFVFPIMFIMLDPGYVHIDLPEDNSVSQQNFCYPTMSSSISMVRALEASGFGATTLLGLDSLREALADSYVSLMLHPLVALFISLVFIRYFMTLLDGDTYELMKMVAKVI